MTKAELVSEVHARAGEGLSRRVTREVVEAIFTIVADSVVRDGRFSAPGFGTLSARTRASRRGRDPRSGQEIIVPPSPGVHFRPARGLRPRLKEG